MSSKPSKKEEKLTVQLLREKLGFKPPGEITALLKKQNEIKTKIVEALSSGPKTVPEISKETGLDKSTVFWYLMSMYKYGIVHEVEKDDEGYFKYKLAKR